MILSFGRPGSDLYPGIGDLVATPVQAGAPLSTNQAGLAERQLSAAQRLERAGRELSWASGGSGSLRERSGGQAARWVGVSHGGHAAAIRRLSLSAAQCGNHPFEA